MLGILFGAAIDAITGGLAVALFLSCIEPQLRWRRASPWASVLVGAIAVAVPLGLVLSRFTPLPSIIVPALLTLLIAAFLFPGALLRVTGGARPQAPDVETVFSKTTEAWARFEVGDIDGAADDISRLDALRTSATGRYIDLWQRFMSEEQARRSGNRESSRTTLTELRAEADRLSAGPADQPSLRLSLASVGLAAIIGASPGLMDARACIGVELILARVEAAPGGALPVTGLLLSEPEPGATLISDQVMDLEVAAESRHDPDTRAQLVEAGFVTATARDWLAADGRHISADVFVFGDAAGALSFQRSVNRYACRFSNEAFEGPLHGVGLQVRRSTGDPIEEQVSWVADNRRYVVSVRALFAPADHQRIQRIADRAVEDMGG